MDNDEMVFSDLMMSGQISEKYFHNLPNDSKELVLVQLFAIKNEALPNLKALENTQKITKIMKFVLGSVGCILEMEMLVSNIFLFPHFFFFFFFFVLDVR